MSNMGKNLEKINKQAKDKAERLRILRNYELARYVYMNREKVGKHDKKQ